MIKDRTAIHGNIDPKLIYPDIKVAQDMYIHPILGTALYVKLETIISDGTITSNVALVNYKNLLDRYIVDTLMYYVLAELSMTLSYQFWNKGVLRKQGVDTDLPSESEIIAIGNRYKNRAEYYSNRLRLYLQQNASTMFSEYLNPGNGLDDINPENKSFSMPVWLGDSSDCGKSFEEKYQGNKPNCD
jgi:hypothetical protein